MAHTITTSKSTAIAVIPKQPNTTGTTGTALIIPISQKNRTDPIKLDEFDMRAQKLETTLNALALELENTNNDAQLSLGLIDDKETKSTLKIANIYKELGQLDTSYQSITARIKDCQEDITTISNQVNEWAQLDKPNSRSHQLADRSLALTRQLEHTARLLKQSISDNSLAIKTLGSLTLTELDIDQLNSKTDETNTRLQTQNTHILTLQSVDKALATRAVSLEQSSEQLKEQAELLSNTINDLGVRTDALITVTRNQKGLIAGLHNLTRDLGDSLAHLSSREATHYKTLGLALLLLLVASFAYVVFDQMRSSTSQVATTTNSQSSYQNQIAVTSLDTQLEAVTAKINHISDQVEHNQTNATEIATELDAKLNTVSKEIIEINDQVDSVRGQFVARNPSSQLGSDNTLHGPQWLAKLPSEHFVIDLGLFANKNALYQAATRYSYYFDKQLAYFPVNLPQGKQFVLIYASFNNAQEAHNVAIRLPRIGQNDARVEAIGVVKQALGQL